jgi:preprotein translocase subunit SecD
MARRTNPLRTLVVFFLGIVVLYGLVALGGAWTPALGLDLEGGTRIRLTAVGDNVTPESLDEARGIIDARVNGTGVSEAEVTTEGNRYIVVEIPGDSSRSDLVEVVQRQAQLRFRLVAQYGAGTAQPTAEPSPSGSGAPSPSTTPGGGVLLPSETATSTASTNPSPTGEPTENETGNNRAPALLPDDSESADPTGTATADPTGPSTADPTGTSSADPTATASPTEGAQSNDPIDQALAFMSNPDEKSLAAYNAFACGTDTRSQSVNPKTGKAEEGDNPAWPLLSCDDQGQKFLLSRSAVEGTELDDASAGIPQGDLSWVVNLEFNGTGTDQFARVSNALVGTQDLFAIVLDGNVISYATMDGRINNGRAMIQGSFNQASAEALATSLRYGSLPIAFSKDASIETIGPSLAGNQLSAGLFAGLIGLLAVMLYCLVYYRGLGLVVLASLIVAGGVTYGVVLVLAKAANFTLTLPGIAGLIVAVGITADSFIVYFERIRDEMRDGKSMRVAVEAGWKRARNTCLAADAVSLLAAVVLYIFAAGVVRGFAFALGISTLIDLVVFFWFTHPMVSWLARFRFFNQGHRMSGLDAEALGIDKINLGTPQTTRQTVGGRA